jgi:hypothetical protein
MSSIAEEGESNNDACVMFCAEAHARFCGTAAQYLVMLQLVGEIGPQNYRFAATAVLCGFQLSH